MARSQGSNDMQLTAEKKKWIMLSVLGAVLLLLVGKMLLNNKPSSALGQARPQPTEEVVDQSDMATVETVSTNRQSSNVPLVEIDWPQGKPRNLFLFDRDTQTAQAHTGPSFDEALREISLQGTIVGSRPKAIINGKLYDIGDKINGFRLKRVEGNSIILERYGREVELSL